MNDTGEYLMAVDGFVFQGEKGRSLPGQKGDEVQTFRVKPHPLSDLTATGKHLE